MKRVRAPNGCRNCPKSRVSTTRSFCPRPTNFKTQQTLVRPFTTSTKQPSKDNIFIFSRAPRQHGGHNHTAHEGPFNKGSAHGQRTSRTPHLPYLISTMRGAGDTEPSTSESGAGARPQRRRNERPPKENDAPAKDHVKRCLPSGSVISVLISRTVRSETVVEAWTVTPDPGSGLRHVTDVDGPAHRKQLRKRWNPVASFFAQWRNWVPNSDTDSLLTTQAPTNPMQEHLWATDPTAGSPLPVRETSFHDRRSRSQVQPRH